MEQVEAVAIVSAPTALDWLRELPGQPGTLVVVTCAFAVALLVQWTRGRWAATSLQEREKKLRHQLSDYEKVLRHLTEAVCLFNANDELIFMNQPFLALYRLPAECAAPGTAFDQIIRRAAELGNFQGQRLEHVLRERLDFVARRESGLVLQRCADGRTIAINHKQMESGGWLATHLDITRLCHAEEQWAFLLRYDPLTRLPNHVYFREMLQHTLSEMSPRQQAGVYYIGITRLNLAFGLFGRGASELLLQQIAQRLARHVVQGSFIARLSEDAFGFLRPELPNMPSAEEFAQRLIVALSQAFDINGHRINVSANIGIAMAPTDGAQPDMLVMFAEQAMRSALDEGPAQQRFFQPEMARREHTYLRVEHDLRRAVEQEEFEVFYQPIIDLRTRRIASFEALVRWRHPVDGILLPGVFIPIAESSGLMAALGRFVLRRACCDAAAWPPEIRVAVNMSATQLKSRSAIESVKTAMLEAWLPPKRLEIELTESHFLDKRSDGLVVLHALRDLGVRVALDDFGTGYASLSSLLEFRFDKIKIDRSFIEDFLQKPEHLEIVRSMIQLANSLGISVVAEGVETADQLAWLRTEGCLEVQSFLLGAPMPATAVLEILQRQDALDVLVA